MKLAPIYRKLLREAGEAAGSLELRNTPIETIVQYATKLGLKIPNLQVNLETAYDLFGMGKTKRKDMPVIDDKDVKDFQKHLSNGFIDLTDPWSDRTNQDDPFPQGLTDKEATNFISNGIRDTSKPDDVVKTQIRMVAARDLIPIQQQVYASKSLNSIAKGGIESTKQFLSTTILVISSDQRIIDGHHRFLSALIIDPNMKLKCLEVDLPIKTLLPLARAYGDAKGNARNL